MSADVLGQRVNHQVGAEIQGTGCDWRCEGGIDHQQGVMRLRDPGGARDIGNTQQRVGRRFQPQHARIFAHGVADRVQVGGVDRAHLDAEPGQGVARELGGAGVVGVADDEVVALAQMRQHHRGARRHAGGERDAGLGLFQHGQLVFELLRGGVVPAGVNKRGFAAQVVCREADFLVDDEGARHHQARRRGAAGGIDFFAGMDRESLAALVLGRFQCHGRDPHRKGH